MIVVAEEPEKVDKKKTPKGLPLAPPAPPPEIATLRPSVRAPPPVLGGKISPPLPKTAPEKEEKEKEKEEVEKKEKPPTQPKKENTSGASAEPSAPEEATPPSPPKSGTDKEPAVEKPPTKEKEQAHTPESGGKEKAEKEKSPQEPEKREESIDKEEKGKPVPSAQSPPRKEGGEGYSQRVLDRYWVEADKVRADIVIYEDPEEYVPIYQVTRPVLHKGTKIILDNIKEEVIEMVNLTEKEFIDPKAYETVKKKFWTKAEFLIDKYLPNITPERKEVLVGNLIHKMIGLGDIEFLLQDANLEEIVVNGSAEPIWVYHKKYGWLKTNLKFSSDEKIYNLMSAIGRKVGRQITNLNPLMDAHLYTGDRVNCTLFPISTTGHTMTIRRFSRDPWTIVKLIDPRIGTLSPEIASFMWLCIQYELNVLVVGGTASGKTSLLNALVPFIPPNQRIISIEDTREIELPKFLHWVPLSSRQPNAEGKGGVTMLDLLANSLRMRPDRIIIGEIRRSKEAEVMFEAIRTGHSAYATFHADKAEEAYNRLINPPINLPEPSLSALHCMIVQYRHRRRGIRRTLEVAEIIPAPGGTNKVNIVYKWNPRDDTFERIGRYIRVMNEINMYTGMTEKELEQDLLNKQAILRWMVEHKIYDVNPVGKVIAEYYRDEDFVVKHCKNNGDPKEILGSSLAREVEARKDKALFA